MTRDRLNVPKIDGLVAQVLELRTRATEIYTPIVADLIQSNSHDSNRIEHTLDNLLGFAHHPAITLLYRRLNRHYATIDPEGAASYASALDDELKE